MHPRNQITCPEGDEPLIHPWLLVYVRVRVCRFMFLLALLAEAPRQIVPLHFHTYGSLRVLKGRDVITLLFNQPWLNPPSRAGRVLPSRSYSPT